MLKDHKKRDKLTSASCFSMFLGNATLQGANNSPTPQMKKRSPPSSFKVSLSLTML